MRKESKRLGLKQIRVMKAGKMLTENRTNSRLAPHYSQPQTHINKYAHLHICSYNSYIPSPQRNILFPRCLLGTTAVCFSHNQKQCPFNWKCYLCCHNLHWHLRDLASALLHKNTIQCSIEGYFSMFTLHTSIPFILHNRLELLCGDFANMLLKWRHQLWSVCASYLKWSTKVTSTVSDAWQHDITAWKLTARSSVCWASACAFAYRVDRRQKQGPTGRADTRWVSAENHS